MQVWLGEHQQPDCMKGAAVTIGNFDGVHCGHRHILSCLRQQAHNRGLISVVVIFEPQPQEFFARKLAQPLPYRLTPLRDKLALLAESSCVDAVYVLNFDQSFADTPAMEFVRKVLIERLNTRYLLVGDDFRFGVKRSGDFALLQAQSEFTTENTPSVLINDVRASSTAVRQALEAGNLTYAQMLLGHEYTLSGKVKYGQQLGRKLGCPTANVDLPPLRYALNGVFVVDVSGDFGRKRGVASFGLNPTVSTDCQQKLEVHIFDFDADLYEQKIKVHFLHKLRDELKFDCLSALQAQIEADMVAARIWQAA